MTTQAKIKINGYSTFLSDYMQPESLASLKIEDAESEATNMILESGDTIVKTMFKVSQPTSISLNSNNLKVKDPVLYRDLQKAGSIGSGAIITVGLESTTYNSVTINSPLKTMGNSGEDNEISITFGGSGKR